MIGSYIAFTRANFSLLSYGIILMILSSPGQTFFISLFIDDFRNHFSITGGDVGMVFAIATFASALALPYLGQKIDGMALRTFTMAVGSLLCLGCVTLGLSPSSALIFGFCVFLLRLGGQGLMVHTAMTATARAFPADSGKAIAVVSLFYSAALVFVPAITVSAIGLFGWRWTWLLSGTITIVGICVANCLLPRQVAGTDDMLPAGRAKRSHAARPGLGLMLLACPVMLAVSFIFTGLLFHQAVLANEKGWSLEWMAACFSAFAISQAVTSLAAGLAIDRMRAVRILPFFLSPLAAALCLVAFVDGGWIAPVYMALLGISAAIDLKLGTILWGDLFGAGQLGYVRARFEAIRIIVTGSAPPIVGKLLDFGIPLTRQAAIYACYALCVSAFAVLLRRHASRMSRASYN